MSQITISSNTSGTASFTIASPATDTNRTLLLPDASTTLVGTDAAQTLTNKTISGGTILLSNSIAVTGNSSNIVSSIPSWAKRLTLNLDNISTNGTSGYHIQIGTISSIETTGYTGAYSNFNAGTSFVTVNYTGSGYSFIIGSAAYTFSGSLVLTKLSASANIWICSGDIGTVNATVYRMITTGRKELTGTLSQLTLATVNGTDTFDSGELSVMIEG